MRLLFRTSLLVTLVACVVTVAGCVVEERTVVERPRRPCPAGEWIGGHYGPRGRWHPGHWRCPGVIEVVEVD
jgi:hypothetical protein